MTPVDLGVLLLLASGAAYVQTVTGFALGLLMMGGVGLTGVASLPDTAVLISVLSLTNTSHVLLRNHEALRRREFAIVSGVSFVFLAMGYGLLELLVATSLDWLRLLLGVVIIMSSGQLLFRPAPRRYLSSGRSFAFFAALSGLMGGLFSTSGPPLVYHFYRQPLSTAAIRQTLIAVFSVNSIWRLALVAAAGAMPARDFWWGLLCIPAVVLFTVVGRRCPPPLGPTGMRRVAFALLLLSGAALAGPAAFALLDAPG